MNIQRVAKIGVDAFTSTAIAKGGKIEFGGTKEEWDKLISMPAEQFKLKDATVEGKSICVKLVQPLKALSPIVIKPSATLADTRFKQFWNALLYYQKK